MRGMAFGAMGGAIMGAAGAILPREPAINTLHWKDRNGNLKVFSHHELIEKFDLIKNLTIMYDARHLNEDALNESFRNLQSAMVLYHRFDSEENVGLMDHVKVRNYSIRATKAMEALLVNAMAIDSGLSTQIEDSMMTIHLALEEVINEMRVSSKDILPNIESS